MRTRSPAQDSGAPAPRTSPAIRSSVVSLVTVSRASAKRSSSEWLSAFLTAHPDVYPLLVLDSPARRERVHFDLPGALLLAMGLIAITLGLSFGQEWGWSSPRLVGVGAEAGGKAGVVGVTLLG